MLAQDRVGDGQYKPCAPCRARARRHQPDKGVKHPFNLLLGDAGASIFEHCFYPIADGPQDHPNVSAVELCILDQGSQFMSVTWTDRLKRVGTRISMDGKGRCLDNILIARLWRSLKYEYVYLRRLRNCAAVHLAGRRRMTCYQKLPVWDELGGPSRSSFKHQTERPIVASLHNVASPDEGNDDSAGCHS